METNTRCQYCKGVKPVRHSCLGRALPFPIVTRNQFAIRDHGPEIGYKLWRTWYGPNGLRRSYTVVDDMRDIPYPASEWELEEYLDQIVEDSQEFRNSALEYASLDRLLNL